MGSISNIGVGRHTNARAPIVGQPFFVKGCEKDDLMISVT